MVPRVLHKEGKKSLRDLDYEADVLAAINFNSLSYRTANEFTVREYDLGKQQAFTVDLKEGAAFDLETEMAGAEIIVAQILDRPGLVRRMLDVVPNPWQGARILDEALTALRAKESEKNIVNARFQLVDHIKRTCSDR